MKKAKKRSNTKTKRIPKTKKTIKKIKETKKTEKVCNSCIFFVENREKPGVGTCFQVRGEIKKDEPWKCDGKFFKKGEMKFNNEQGFD